MTAKELKQSIAVLARHSGRLRTFEKSKNIILHNDSPTDRFERLSSHVESGEVLYRHDNPLHTYGQSKVACFFTLKDKKAGFSTWFLAILF